MAAPIIAGLAFGCGVYYLGRVGPRIAARVVAAERARTQQNLSTFIRNRGTLLPYHTYEYAFSPTMTEEEATQLLGFSSEHTGGVLRTRPTPEQVKQRYRELIKDFHSDVAGSPLLATKINEARDILSR